GQIELLQEADRVAGADLALDERAVDPEERVLRFDLVVFGADDAVISHRAPSWWTFFGSTGSGRRPRPGAARPRTPVARVGSDRRAWRIGARATWPAENGSPKARRTTREPPGRST